MLLRKVTMEDAKVIFDWANDLLTRQNSFSQAPILWETHISWYKKKLEDNDCLFLMLEDDDNLCGIIRFDSNEKNEAYISYNINPACRKMGYGSRMIKESEALARDYYGEIELIAEVKKDNWASQRCFEKNGYSIKESDEKRVVYCKSI